MIVTAFYKFVTIEDPQTLQSTLRELGRLLEVKGTILLAHEGINGSLSGSIDTISAFFESFQSDNRFQQLDRRIDAPCHEHAFQRFKVKIKDEIIAFDKDLDASNSKTGTYVKPQDWNRLLQDENVIVIDTRNDYETSIGTFRNTIDPQTQKFYQFKDFVRDRLDPEREPKIAMFCTGGIRCEKASAYMINQGFREVYHLQGGILSYLENIPKEESMWDGECFVFDDRVAVGHGLKQGQTTLCQACGNPIPKQPGDDLKNASGSRTQCYKCNHRQRKIMETA